MQGKRSGRERRRCGELCFLFETIALCVSIMVFMRKLIFEP
jgi:hypothetical protein